MPDIAAPALRFPVRRRLRRCPALDGVRGLAILAVMAFHFPTRAAVPGGFLGVDVFFALSGFLLTCGLLADVADRGASVVVRFWTRRARRLAPALWAFVAVYVAAAALFGSTGWFGAEPFGPRHGAPVPLASAARGGFLAVTALFNWARADRIALPPLGHLWFAAVLFQFCLIWPVVLIVLTRARPSAAVAVTLLVTVLSCGLAVLLWHGGQGADRIYFGSDTRVEGLLWGALGGMLWSSGVLGRVPPKLVGGAATVSAVVIVGLVLLVREGPVKYLVALPTVAVATTIVVAHLVDTRRESAVARALRAESLQWLGRRSYALYLWHYPIATWLHPLPDVVGVPLAMVASGVAAELSWRLVERRWVASAPDGGARIDGAPGPTALTVLEPGAPPLIVDARASGEEGGPAWVTASEARLQS